MLKCQSCGRYTLSVTCPSCSGKAASPHPAKFSPVDSYGKYRRMMKTAAAETQPSEKGTEQ